MQMDAHVRFVVNWLSRDPPTSALEPDMLLVYREAGCGKSRVVSLACEEVARDFRQGMAWDSLHGRHSVSDMRAAMDTDSFSRCMGLRKYARVLDGVEADVLLDFVRREKLNLIGCEGGWHLVVITSTFTDDEAINSVFEHRRRIEGLEEPEDVLRHLRQKASPFLDNVRVGRRLLEACEGSPLAISILGGLVSAAGRDILTSEQLARDLQQYRRQDHCRLQTVFVQIGYDALAEGEQRCFLYTCLMFPLSEVLSRIKLALIWIAEGLVDDQNQAESWIQQLVRRNLLERAGGVQGGGDTDVLVLQPMRNFSIGLASPSYYTNYCAGTDAAARPRKNEVKQASVLLGAKLDLSIIIQCKNLKTLHVWGSNNRNRQDAGQDPLSTLSCLKNLVHLLLSAAYKGATIKSVKRGCFPQLQHLYIMHFPNLQTWKRIQEGAMPNLQSLILTDCPKLNRQRPEGLGNNVTLAWD